MTNWSCLFTNVDKRKSLKLFASGEKSGRWYYDQYACGDLGGTVRNLLRDKGVEKARKLAKRALRRRGITV